MRVQKENRGKQILLVILNYSFQKTCKHRALCCEGIQLMYTVYSANILSSRPEDEEERKTRNKIAEL